MNDTTFTLQEISEQSEAEFDALFAEELPEQNDLATTGSTLGTISCIGSAGSTTSTVSTTSSFSS